MNYHFQGMGRGGGIPNNPVGMLQQQVMLQRLLHQQNAQKEPVGGSGLHVVFYVMI